MTFSLKVHLRTHNRRHLELKGRNDEDLQVQGPASNVTKSREDLARMKKVLEKQDVPAVLKVEPPEESNYDEELIRYYLVSVFSNQSFRLF